MRQKKRHTGYKMRRAVGAAVAAMCLAWAATPAGALTINLTFDSGASDSPAFDPTGANLQPIIQQAADFWEDIIEDSWTLNINYYYDDLSDPNGTLADHLNQGTSGGKPTDARIRIDTQRYGVDRDWWFDPTPSNHSEFDLEQTLYRDLTATQQADWFGGSPPEVLEVGYRGSAVAGGAADGHYDLFSTVIHEIGHAVGLTAAVSSGEYADGDYDVTPALVFGSNTDIKGDFHLDARTALMCGGCGAVSVRRMPTATDVLAAATGAGWSQIDLPRQDFWGGSDWNTAFNWEGGQVPGAYDDAYVRQREHLVAQARHRRHGHGGRAQLGHHGARRRGVGGRHGEHPEPGRGLHDRRAPGRRPRDHRRRNLPDRQHGHAHGGRADEADQ